jgi:hypothetical protein
MVPYELCPVLQYTTNQTTVFINVRILHMHAQTAERGKSRQMSLLMNFGANNSSSSSSSSSSSNKRAARSSADIASTLPDTALWHILASPGLRAVDIILGNSCTFYVYHYCKQLLVRQLKTWRM